MPQTPAHPPDTGLEPNIHLALNAIKFRTLYQKYLPEESVKTPSFPFSNWKRLAALNLLQQFKLSTPTGSSPYKAIASTGYALTRYHLPLGLTMTWVGQILKSHFLYKLACHDTAYIEAILSGESLCALAISEPDIGAHPKHLTCTASKHGSSYTLNGEKSFVSHGPYADRFIVLAITDQNQGQKQYSAFLVSASSKGLQLLPPQPIKGLQPSSHCNIIFTNCRVSASALIGTAGHAFEEISLPMRTLEDSLMLAPIAGAMQAQLDYLAHASSDCSKPLKRNKMGELLSLTESAKELGIIATSKLDQHEIMPDLTPLIIGFRSLVEQVQTTLLEFHDVYPGLCELAGDIQILCNIGRQATAARTASLADHFLAEQQKG